MITTQPISDIKITPQVKREKLERAVPEQKASDFEKEEKKEYLNKKEISDAVDETNRIVFGDTNRFEFKIHEGTGRMLVKLVDNETDEVIKEIPPEKILDLIANIWEMVGILVDERG
ncbi:flagellar protein FlaG [Gudongella oleilytica]|jgi:flagellar protein FlaG|uniref:flagellar protein FlaG n=1 Tax=Gudongella oleilytica TaxID=1582259 RepID=UPI002A36C51A|nr:flagellar protein FlaG [Gudongella oleilytica]MDY0256547.1 flagellar protein FlaG [Gudongella oleilytica]